ncbi:DUF3179 domain-containing protein [Amphiplicatus metriothermophilus]|uniref:DUF3179 domain-containing protein n=1 Tax=Amphiplicatus metriothermophilus TaxID=1519374 RepID=A0A239PJQ1_9PROT|nr:DUF3179 domain-containing protein [Amphiplicatus metriothermophilus]MBB5518117.1 hypothetical protein [Amphiplicatus metriothermophilus]SNT67549.1 Protein of unknown function [Amphiplicatus metriothermophilus]
MGCRLSAITALAFLLFAVAEAASEYDRRDWPNWRQWPHTDFSRCLAPPSEFMPGGPPKDGIPAIDEPVFEQIAAARYDPREPVIALSIDGDARAYPLSILMWHEIVNDVVAGRPVVVTFCPLCNAAVVFDRTVEGEITTFGVTGILRNSDLVMYDRASESWWQQYTGRALVGARAGARLERLPARLISFEQFRRAYPQGVVLKPNDPRLRAYGRNPYVNYDTRGRPFNVFAEPPEGFSKMERVVVDDTAWRMTAIAEAGVLIDGDLRFAWTPGQASALDAATIAEGRDVGSVVVERRAPSGDWRPVPYDVVFAFVFAAFHPDGEWRV